MTDSNRNDKFGLKDGDSYIGTDGHHHHFHEGLKEGDTYIGSDGHHHRYVDVASVERGFFGKMLLRMKSLFSFSKSSKQLDDYEGRHKGLVEGQLYVGSDGHHHHYHAHRNYNDSSQDYKRSAINSRRMRKIIFHYLFITLTVLAICVICYAMYIYSIE